MVLPTLPATSVPRRCDRNRRLRKISAGRRRPQGDCAGRAAQWTCAGVWGHPGPLWRRSRPAAGTTPSGSAMRITRSRLAARSPSLPGNARRWGSRILGKCARRTRRARFFSWVGNTCPLRASRRPGVVVRAPTRMIAEAPQLGRRESVPSSRVAKTPRRGPDDGPAPAVPPLPSPSDRAHASTRRGASPSVAKCPPHDGRHPRAGAARRSRCPRSHGPPPRRGSVSGWFISSTRISWIKSGMGP